MTDGQIKLCRDCRHYTSNMERYDPNGLLSSTGNCKAGGFDFVSGGRLLRDAQTARQDDISGCGVSARDFAEIVQAGE